MRTLRECSTMAGLGPRTTTCAESSSRTRRSVSPSESVAANSARVPTLSGGAKFQLRINSSMCTGSVSGISASAGAENGVARGSDSDSVKLDTSINDVGRWDISALPRVAGFRLTRTVREVLTAEEGMVRRPRRELQEEQSLDVVYEVRQSDLHRRSGDADGADERIHPVLLLREHMLDLGADFRFGVVGAPDRAGHGAPLWLFAMDMNCCGGFRPPGRERAN
jgi:hypothetical protein